MHNVLPLIRVRCLSDTFITPQRSVDSTICWNSYFLVCVAIALHHLTSHSRPVGHTVKSGNLDNSNEDILLLVGWHEVMHLGAESTLTAEECIVAKVAEDYVWHSDDKLQLHYSQWQMINSGNSQWHCSKCSLKTSATHNPYPANVEIMVSS